LRTSNNIRLLLGLALVRVSRVNFPRGFHPRLYQSAALQLKAKYRIFQAGFGIETLKEHHPQDYAGLVDGRRSKFFNHVCFANIGPLLARMLCHSRGVWPGNR
jgi:hypothetical protein